MECACAHSMQLPWIPQKLLESLGFLGDGFATEGEPPTASVSTLNWSRVAQAAALTVPQE